MNERIKELAEQAGLEELGDSDWCSLNHPDVRAEHLERFAELVRQDAMEEAATICDGLNYNGIDPLGCAAAIRNRAEEQA
jgi:hypothetical protein